MPLKQHSSNYTGRSWSGRHHKHHCFQTRQRPCCPQGGSSVEEEQPGFEQGVLHMWIHTMVRSDRRTHFGSGNCKDQNILLRGYVVEEDLGSSWLRRGMNRKTWLLWRGGMKTVQPLGRHPHPHRRLAYYYGACWKMLSSSSFLSWLFPDE